MSAMNRRIKKKHSFANQRRNLRQFEKFHKMILKTLTPDNQEYMLSILNAQRYLVGAGIPVDYVLSIYEKMPDVLHIWAECVRDPSEDISEYYGISTADPIIYPVLPDKFYRVYRKKYTEHITKCVENNPGNQIYQYLYDWNSELVKEE